MKKVILTESQVKNVINNFINEQTAPVPAAPPAPATPGPFTIDFGTTFQSGDFEFNPQYKQAVNEKIKQLLGYIQGKQLKDFKLIITPGESQVTNQPPFQKPGSLAQKRAEVLREYMAPILKQSLTIQPTIEIAPFILGKTPYKNEKGQIIGKKDDSKYTVEQFVKVSVVVTTKSVPPPPPPIETPYKITAKDKESIFFPTAYSNYLGAFAQYPTRQSTDIKDAGNLNTGTQDVTLKVIKKDTVPYQVTDVYLIPFAWWNNRTGAETNFLQPQDLEYIKKNYKRV